MHYRLNVQGQYIFFYKMYTFIHQACSKFIKNNIKEMYIVTEVSYFK